MRNLLAQSMPIIVLVLTTAAILYLSARLAWAFGLLRWATTLIVGALIIGAMVCSIFIMRTNLTSTISHILSNTANILLGIALFAICTTIALDLLNLLLRLAPRTYGLVLVGTTALISLFASLQARNTRVMEVDITLPHLTSPTRLAHLSDTHFGHFWGKSRAQKLAQLIDNQHVDAVLITGDMFDGKVRLDTAIIRPFTELGIPVYFAEGNHDGYTGSDEIKALLRSQGVIVLENELTNHGNLQIIGLDYLVPDAQTPDAYGAAHSHNTMQNTLPRLGIDPTRPSILMHHNPVGAKYAAENGVNLYLAGHTHAGQIFPATLLAKLMFEYNAGLYRYDENMQIYVSQGAGTFGPPMRLGTHSELTIINLKPPIK